METDKVVTDIPSPRDGTIASIYGTEGETINVGDALVEIEMEGVDGEQAIEEANKPETEAVEEEGAGVVGTLEIAGNNAFLPASGEGMEDTNTETPTKKKKILATPVARALAREMDIDINLVKGSGPAGRVMKEDIKDFDKQEAYKAPKQFATEDTSELIEIEKLSQLRKTIAKNMIESKHNAAHMTVFDDAEVSELIRVRNKFKAQFENEGNKLNYLPFILKATALALKKHKSLNAQMDLEKGVMIYKKYYNIGIAVDTPDGLIVPVIRDVDKKSIKQLSIETTQIAQKARDRSISLEDMRDGTFTLTSYGSIGGKYAVPVINYPQAAILGIGRMSEQPIVKNGELAVGNTLPLSLSVDHRIVDGGDVTRFLNDIISYLNEPVRLIMD